MLEHDDIIDDEDDVTLDEDNAVTKNRQRAANDMTLESALDLEHDDDDDDQQLELEGSDSAKQASDDAVALKRRRPYSPPQAYVTYHPSESGSRSLTPAGGGGAGGGMQSSQTSSQATSAGSADQHSEPTRTSGRRRAQGCVRRSLAVV